MRRMSCGGTAGGLASGLPPQCSTLMISGAGRARSCRAGPAQAHRPTQTSADSSREQSFDEQVGMRVIVQRTPPGLRKHMPARYAAASRTWPARTPGGEGMKHGRHLLMRLGLSLALGLLPGLAFASSTPTLAPAVIDLRLQELMTQAQVPGL